MRFSLLTWRSAPSLIYFFCLGVSITRLSIIFRPWGEVITIIRQLQETKYLHDISFLQVFGDKKIKLVTCNTVRNSGVEDERESRIVGVNDFKLDNNIARARSSLLELALCNDWEYFVTLTASKALVERYSLESVYAALLNSVRRERRSGRLIKYVLVPEQHKDGAWHFHGFISGAKMREFSPHENLPKYVKDQLFSGCGVFDWSAYSKAVGYTICEPIRSPEAAARYVTKYITKDLARSVSQSGDHLYYCSKGLERAKRIKKGRLSSCHLESVCAPVTGEYSGEHGSVRWYDYTPELLNQLSSVLL